ncbi:hypothetical protein B0H17DRAFT_321403 [Mycena rosella]|uniref:Uncharacterized protein n=1 Tax=Mycena rosella TaxID=1033263 RepID=A0AAD7G393_MYCRO|nr:hypothetical protein B0H17DRAFT_321403 [Mycena rosella]
MITICMGARRHIRSLDGWWGALQLRARDACLGRSGQRRVYGPSFLPANNLHRRSEIPQGLPHGWAKVLYRENETATTPRSSVEKTLLRINLKIFPEETHLTSVTVTPEMQIQDVLKLICWKMRFQVPEYTLALAGGVEALEMDRTVADLEGKRELVMVKRRASTAIPNEA